MHLIKVTCVFPYFGAVYVSTVGSEASTLCVSAYIDRTDTYLSASWFTLNPKNVNQTGIMPVSISIRIFNI